MSGPFGSQQWMYNASSGFYPYELNNSLKFEDGDSSYLSRTPASAGNRKTWTWSAWVKRGNLGSTQMIFAAHISLQDRFNLRFQSSDALRVFSLRSNTLDWNYTTSQVFRDVGAWYHILVALDTDNATASDRLRLYVNGERVTAFSSSTNPSSGYSNTLVNYTDAHQIGTDTRTSNYFDGYMAEVNFVDGTALNPTSFGETKEGIWIPKQYSGSYGTNGFYLPFKETTSANGFNTVTYTGNGGNQSIEGVGFQPDFVWTKQRNASANHRLFDSVRGTGKNLISNSTTSEGTDSNTLTSFDSDGFSLGNSTQVNDSSDTYVAWCWGGGTNDKTYTVTVVSDYGNKYRFDGHGTSSIALNLTEGATYTFNYPSAHPLRFSTTSNGTHGGGSEYTTGVTHVSDTQTTFTVPSGAPVLYYYCSIHSGMGGQINTNTTDGPTHAEGTILSRAKPNQTYGFSIVSYTGTGSAATVSHGLGVAPKMIIIKDRGDTSTWIVYTEPTGNNNSLVLALTQAAVSTTNFQSTDPTSSVFSISGGGAVGGSSSPYIAYCFADVSGYQKIGSYSGTGSSGNAITGLGFKPAWLMIKRTDVASDWIIWDATRDVDGKMGRFLYPNLSNAEAVASNVCTFDSDGFTLNDGTANRNASGGTYIYLAIADTRDALFTSDASGNGNNWTPNALQHSDVMPDTPTDGFATWNAVDPHPSGFLMSEGNLKLVRSTASADLTATINIPSSGAYYFEVLWNGVGSNTLIGLGSFVHQYRKDGKIYNNNSLLGTYATYTSGDIVGVGVNADNDLISFYKNGTLIHSFTGSVTSADLSVYTYMTTGASQIANFGQDSSFNANKIPQGNADANGKGDFFYAPPSEYLALCNANLPDPAIDPNKGENPEDYFNTVLYTSNQSTQSITGVGFQPDWVWIKDRSSSGYQHGLFDSVRGAGKSLESSTTTAERTQTDSVTSFDLDGFSLGDNSEAGPGVNYGSTGHVAWNWKAGGTGVTNDDGSIQSTVSANTEAGFSIVSYTGTGSNATIGHGLGVAPDMIIVKNRSDGADSWQVYHSANTSAPETERLKLNGTDATLDLNLWQDTAPTSSVFYIATDSAVNGSGENLISYCFANKEGYSKFGNYTGNGSSDGPFVYIGFRPSWVMIKRAITSSTGSWAIVDSERAEYNPETDALLANSTIAESTGYLNMDLLSNGFKLRDSGGTTNTSGDTYIYMAFAEQPFKYSNAR
jgi:hypothetical protein